MKGWLHGNRLQKQWRQQIQLLWLFGYMWGWFYFSFLRINFWKHCWELFVHHWVFPKGPVHPRTPRNHVYSCYTLFVDNSVLLPWSRKNGIYENTVFVTNSGGKENMPAPHEFMFPSWLFILNGKKIEMLGKYTGYFQLLADFLAILSPLPAVCLSQLMNLMSCML